MINHKEIEQGTIEWHEMKWGKIGGTLASGLRVKSDTLFLDILSQRAEEFEPTDSFENDATIRGHELEPFAREYLSKYVGVEFGQTGWLQSEKNELLGISPDGITDCETIACEIKCLSRKEHWAILLSQEIPKKHIPQVIHYFTVNPRLKELWFIAYRPESKKQFIQKVTRDTLFDLGDKKEVEVKQVSEKTGKPIKSKFIKESVLISVDDAAKGNLVLANKLLKEIKEEENKHNSDF